MLSEEESQGQELDNTASGSEGTVDATEVDPFDAARAALETDTTTQDANNATTQAEDTFLSASDLDPRKLPPELQPIFKRMQGVYTKKSQELASIREKAEVVDRFYGDRDFAQQTLVQWAAQNGFQLLPINGGQAPQAAQGAKAGGIPPAALVDAFKNNLAPELQWMAEPMAAAMGQSMQSMLSPVLQQQQAAQSEARVQEWNKYAGELTGIAPGWEEHEDTMSELFDFFGSPAQFHPKYGSKLEMLYTLATGKAAAMKQATDRVNSAAKNRVSSGRGGGDSRPTIVDSIAKAKTSNDAWELAKRHALAQVGKT